MSISETVPSCHTQDGTGHIDMTCDRGGTVCTLPYSMSVHETVPSCPTWDGMAHIDMTCEVVQHVCP